MGLDFSHCDASWGYGGFARFRARLAATVGILDYHEINNTNDPRFKKIKKDPLFYLLAHSDCDGHLTPSQCKKLFPRLEEIIYTWPDDYDRQQAIELCEGMRDAAKRKQNLRFT